MIHHDLKLIFVHINKCGGNSLEDMLHRLDGKVRPPRANHNSIFEYLGAMPAEKAPGYFKVAIVRNPWDRIVSEYRAHRRRVAAGDRRKDLFAMFGSDLSPSFVGFLHRRTPKFKTNQLDWIAEPRWCWDNNCLDWKRRSNDCRLLVDYVGRFENLDDEAREICRRVGRDFPGLRMLNSGGPRLGYREYYNQETQDLVTKMHERDIEYFGYEF